MLTVYTWWFASFRGAYRGPWWTVKYEGLPQLSPQAALVFDLLFNCSELGITRTPTF